MRQTEIGLEVLARQPELGAQWGRCGLVCNQASLTSDFRPAYQICQQLWGKRLKALFGPQHGFWGTAQDNMIETPHMALGTDKLPIYSLYSETREPSAEMLDGLDTLVIDLQIVGCRIYTFKATIAGCLRAARAHGKKVVVLDRPNPLGGVELEGRCLDPDMKSFVGPMVMPMRHGLTTAEAALLFNAEIGAELEVVRMQHWDPEADYRMTSRPWVMTSPNLPSLEPIFVYPGMVLFEGTNVSEGRGSGLPFQLIGAPYIKDPAQLIKRIADLCPGSEGLFLREACFEPTSGKWARQLCRGFQIHVLEPEKVKSFNLALAMICAFRELGGDAFAWKEPPYEYEYETLPMKVILGSSSCLPKLENFDWRDDYWRHGLASFRDKAEAHLLYKRSMKIN